MDLGFKQIVSTLATHHFQFGQVSEQLEQQKNLQPMVQLLELQVNTMGKGLVELRGWPEGLQDTPQKIGCLPQVVEKFGTLQKVLQDMGPTCRELEKRIQGLEAAFTGFESSLKTLRGEREASVKSVVEAQVGQQVAEMAKWVQQVDRGATSTFKTQAESLEKLVAELNLHSRYLQEVTNRLEVMESTVGQGSKSTTEPPPPPPHSATWTDGCWEGGSIA